MRRIRILLAGDQPQTLNLLQMLPEPDYDVVGVVEDGQTLVTAAQCLTPEIVVMDIDMPILNGIETTRQLRKSVPDCCVIFQSSYGEPDLMAEAYAAGASAYLVKGFSPSLQSAIQAVLDHPERAREWDTDLLTKFS